MQGYCVNILLLFFVVVVAVVTVVVILVGVIVCIRCYKSKMKTGKWSPSNSTLCVCVYVCMCVFTYNSVYGHMRVLIKPLNWVDRILLLL